LRVISKGLICVCFWQAFAREGAKVIATDINESKLQELESYRGEPFAFRFTVSPVWEAEARSEHQRETPAGSDTFSPNPAPSHPIKSVF
jgi:hypothetical protein